VRRNYLHRAPLGGARWRTGADRPFRAAHRGSASCAVCRGGIEAPLAGDRPDIRLRAGRVARARQRPLITQSFPVGPRESRPAAPPPMERPGRWIHPALQVGCIRRTRIGSVRVAEHLRLEPLRRLPDRRAGAESAARIVQIRPPPGVEAPVCRRSQFLEGGRGAVVRSVVEERCERRHKSHSPRPRIRLPSRQRREPPALPAERPWPRK
jgi:hypothetical protein